MTIPSQFSQSKSLLVREDGSENSVKFDLFTRYREAYDFLNKIEVKSLSDL
jgi:hypothetical protein